MRAGGAWRLIKDVLCIIFYAVAEVCERVARACEDKGLSQDTKDLVETYVANRN